jgi:hypothetical protein
MPALSILLAAALTLPATHATRMSETARVGGSGGNRTVSMDCGSGAFIVGVTASGGRDGAFGFNLVRRIKFTCRAFDGTTPGGTSQTTEAVADKQPGTNFSTGTAACPSASAIDDVELYAGSFIDRLNRVDCITTDVLGMNWVNANIGGDGGSREFLKCPFNEALYKVEARVGDAIDSLKGFCRAFSTATASVPEQMTSTVTPKPSRSNPTVIPVGSSKSFSFTISAFNSEYRTVDVGITGETDLLGFAGLNPPEFRLELLNPSGLVVASKTFSKVSDSVCTLTYTINANGVWKLRVTNLKKDVGSLNVTFFGAAAH